MSDVLTLRRVHKRYRRAAPWVLAGVDLEVRPGAVVTVTGANGSGKSTLLRVAAGVTEPSAGRADRPRRVAFVPERQPERVPFTASGYLAHLGRIRGLDPARAGNRGGQLLERLGMTSPEAPWAALSKGNRQKVLLAQAFGAGAEALVLDEPYTALDDPSRTVLDDLIESSAAGGAAVLMSAHGTDGRAGRVQPYHLADGRVQRTGPPAPEGRGARRVVLRGAAGVAGAGGLGSLPGVRSWRADDRGERLELVVADPHGDDVLRQALAQGWSVESVDAVEG